MSKFILPLISVALLTAMSSTAQTNAQYRDFSENPIRPSVEQKTATEVRINPISTSATSLMPPPTGSADDIVSDPQGQKFENAIRSDVSLYSFMGLPRIQTGEALIGDFVIAENGNIWIKPVSTYYAPGYIELEKQDDGTYVAHTPQVFYDQDNYDGTHTLAWATRFVLKQTEDGANYYDAEENADGTFNTDMRFTYENGILKQVDQRVSDQGLPLELLAMTDPEGKWAVWGSGCITIQPLPEDMKPVSLPEDKEEHPVVFGYKKADPTTGELTSLYQENVYVTSPSDPDAVYVKVPSTFITDVWVRGKIEDDRSWKFEKQYLGTCPSANMHIWFTPATFETVQYEQNGSQFYGLQLTQTDALVMKFDESRLAYVSADSDDFEVNASPTCADYIIESFAVPSVHEYSNNVSNPADPSFTSLNPYTEINQFGVMSFFIPNYDVDGNFMNTDKMFYRVFINQDESEPFVLTPEEYASLTENMTDVPYKFNDIFYITCYNNYHNLYFYRSDVNWWGIQSVYKDGDVEKKSNVVWHESVGVDKITTESEEGEAVWYDLHGRRVNNPERGIFIKKTGNKVVKVVL